MRGRVAVALLGGAIAVLVACSSQTSSSQTSVAVDRAAEPTSGHESTTHAAVAAQSATPSPESPRTPTETAEKQGQRKRSGNKFAKRWGQFPWASSAWPNCTAPASSPGIRLNPRLAGLVVVVGDSLIRESRTKITSLLSDIGYVPVFVCAGGKGLPWGEEQLRIMASLKIEPRCLIVNLGTNDLKGTTEQGLQDAVSLKRTGKRLRSLITASSGIEHVAIVDIAANLAIAPSTLDDIGLAPALFKELVAEANNISLVRWAHQANRHPDFIGSDGVHDTEAGEQRRAELIANAVDSQCGPAA